MPTDLTAFFEEYVAAYNQALGDSPDFKRITAVFTDCFLVAGPEEVQCGKNNRTFLQGMKKNYEFYRAIGTKAMHLREVRATPIDDGHVMAKVFYRADYRRADGRELSIEFDGTYLLQTIGGAPKIFAFIAGDEMGVYREHGLVDVEGKPVS